MNDITQHKLLIPEKKVPGNMGAIYDATIFGGAVRVSGFGRFHKTKRGIFAPQDWSVAKVARKDSRLSSSVAGYVPAIAKELGVREFLAPSPSEFNALMCDQRELDVLIPLGEGVVVRRGAKAEGCMVLPRQAFLVSPAGCAVVIAYFPGDASVGHLPELGVAHAGLKSVYGKEQSVTEALLLAFTRSEEIRAQLRIFIAFGISAELFSNPWNHPTWGEYNTKMCKDLEKLYGKECVPGAAQKGHIDLTCIIQKQLVALGVKKEHITLAPAVDLWKHSDETELWYTTRGAFPKRRNLVLVTLTN